MRGKLGLVSRQQTWTPRALPGLTGWWDASDSATLFDAETGGSATAADGEVGRIEDKSGSARHFVQPTSVYRPVRKTAVLNSLDVLRFTAADGESMEGNSWLFDDIVSEGAYTAIAVAKCATAATDDAEPTNNAAVLSELSGGYAAFYFRSSDLVGAMGFSAPSPGMPETAEAAYIIGEWALLTQKWDGTNLSISVDAGTPVSTASSNLYEFETPAFLGAQIWTGTHFDGDLAELIVCNVALSSVDLQKVQTYLSNKWNP